jgi:hypothetical protein
MSPDAHRPANLQAAEPTKGSAAFVFPEAERNEATPMSSSRNRSHSDQVKGGQR